MHKWKRILTVCIALSGIYIIHQAVAQKSLFGVPVETDKEAEYVSKQREKIAKALGPFFKTNQYPEKVDVELFSSDQNQVNIEYTIDPGLQEKAQSLLKSYKPDYAAIVVMNATTGEVLALSSYDKSNSVTDNWALHGGFPAASVFKVVTAGAALDKHKLHEETVIFFNGGSHTLYRKNVMNTSFNRWTRATTLKEAFAQSFNTPFGRLTFEKMNPQDIEQYALKFGFNKQITSDLPFEMGFTAVPDEKSFSLAEIASGYNRVTRMSPVQGAMIAASVAAEGVMPVPSIVKSIRDQKGQVLYESRPVTAATVLTPEGAEKLSRLMTATVERGTSKKVFRSLMPKLKVNEIDIGGKTGSLTGDNPKGKVDWFIGYGKNGDDDRIAVAAITVNKKFWTVKSAYLARQMIETHFKDQLKKPKLQSRLVTKKVRH